MTNTLDPSPEEKNKLLWSIYTSTLVEKEQGKKNSQGNDKLCF